MCCQFTSRLKQVFRDTFHSLLISPLFICLNNVYKMQIKTSLYRFFKDTVRTRTITVIC